MTALPAPAVTADPASPMELALAAARSAPVWDALPLETRERYGYLLAGDGGAWDRLAVTEKARAAEMILQYKPRADNPFVFDFASPHSGTPYTITCLPTPGTPYTGAAKCNCSAGRTRYALGGPPCYHLARFKADVAASNTAASGPVNADEATALAAALRQLEAELVSSQSAVCALLYARAGIRSRIGAVRERLEAIAAPAPALAGTNAAFFPGHRSCAVAAKGGC